MNQSTVVHALQVSLHGHVVGHLAGFHNGRNIFVFADEYRLNQNRPTLGLVTHPNFPGAQKIMSEPWARNQKLHPVFSNLLPEGVLRELITTGLKTHLDNEFQLLAHLGQDLPGALIVNSLQQHEVPDNLAKHLGESRTVVFENLQQENKFSLAGVQMKFSMRKRENRYHLAIAGELGDWIIKTPSTIHKAVPENEYTAMQLASLAGVNIPEIKLVPLNQLDNLPAINLPDETFAFAIKRFDRKEQARIHMEDFAQVLVKYPHEKYQGGNYEQIGRILLTCSQDGFADALQLARRLLVNILLANGDAHLKNWSVLYPDQINPRLTPAYDILTTRVYMRNEQEFSLNLSKTKAWYQVSFEHFERWAMQIGLPWQAVKLHLDDVLDKARTLWPVELAALPMDEQHKQSLIEHWQMLHADFRIKG